jgi:DNA polymerase/3'-5' exonuclease PolX
VAARKGFRYSPFTGLVNVATGAVSGSETEHDLFTCLGLPFTPPEAREK